MEEPETANENKPLLPRTAAGATIVAIPLATILGGMGWVGEKVLTIDEQVVQIQNELQGRVQVVDGFRVMQGEFVEVKAHVDRMQERLRHNEELGIKLDERLVRIETLLETIKEEQDRRRERVYPAPEPKQMTFDHIQFKPGVLK